MRVNVQPGDMLVALTQWDADHGWPVRLVSIQRGDTLLVVSSVAAVPRTTGEVYVEDTDQIEGCCPDRYYVHALWRDRLVETIVLSDSPFCNVIRRQS